MNINMLRDADNDAGFYAAASGADAWRGAVLYVSKDGGGSYQGIASLNVAATMGRVETALGDFAGGNMVDELNSFTVVLTNGSLSSTNYEGLISGVYAALVGDELLYFRDATLVDENTYTITGLLRGRRGSEAAIGTHDDDERFVLLNPATIIRVAQSTADIGMTRLYKAVSNGLASDSATPQSFTNNGAGLKPYACVQLGGGRDASNNATLNWVRRSRISGEWRDNVEIPLGETSESYEVEIFDSGYSTVLRTITGLTSPTTSYSAADQTTDGLTPGDPIYFAVYQRSDVVGRGYQARGVI